MQDQYTGDIGDFGKYGLLRFLFRPPTRLGVVWWLYPNETHKTDGRHVDYLRRPGFRECDAELFDELRSLVESRRRRVSEIERRPILGDAMFFREALDFPAPRVEARRLWLERALAATANCDAVFLDPDNGLQIASCDRAARTAGKFVFFDEIAAFAQRRQSIVIYHHLGRRGSHLEQIHRHAVRLREFGEVIALRWRSYSPRVYFILPTTPLPIDDFLNTSWRNHFQRV
jgi:hypothetical protein